MLVLTRKTSERITIGRDVEVVVLKISGNRVRLGISAPAGISILRDDVAGKPSENGSRSPKSGSQSKAESCFPV